MIAPCSACFCIDSSNSDTGFRVLSYPLVALIGDVGHSADPLRPAPPRWRSPRVIVPTRYARPRRAGDRHGS
ncbi:MAG: hypothetical protein EPN51_28555 [Mycobacterium sp.]|nr:MAG: hypothetical protein EPN51_28555 [Mycobacterium sp.]